MAKSKKKNNLCPECRGLGITCDGCMEQCSYCLGTGYDDLSDSFEHIYRYDDWS